MAMLAAFDLAVTTVAACFIAHAGASTHNVALSMTIALLFAVIVVGEAWLADALAKWTAFAIREAIDILVTFELATVASPALFTLTLDSVSRRRSPAVAGLADVRVIIRTVGTVVARSARALQATGVP
jgi:hypothetical protein